MPATDQPVAAITFEMTRSFDAPLASVWQAWSDAALLQRWWGPKGCTLEVARLEFRPGGFFHYAMQFPGTPKMWGRFSYREIAEGSRIVWLNSFANENCGIARAPFDDACPLEIENTVVFTEAAGKTTVALRAVPFGATAPEVKCFNDLKSSMQEGYGGTLDQLGDLLKKG